MTGKGEIYLAILAGLLIYGLLRYLWVHRKPRRGHDILKHGKW